MYWTHVARKDFADAVRSKLFLALSVLMILFAYLALYAISVFDDAASAETGIQGLSGPMFVLVPIIALIVGYMAIVGERERGSIRYVLSLPLTRGDVLLGKFVGRTAVVTVPIAVGFLVAMPFVYVLYGEFPVITYAEFVTRVLLVAIVFVSLSVGVSGSVDSLAKALGGVVGIFVLFEWLWGIIPLAIYYLFYQEVMDPMEAPAWADFIFQLSPAEATRQVADAIFAASISTQEPLLLQEWVAGIIVLLWILLPLWVGYYRFSRATIS